MIIFCTGIPRWPRVRRCLCLLEHITYIKSLSTWQPLREVSNYSRIEARSMELRLCSSINMNGKCNTCKSLHCWVFHRSDKSVVNYGQTVLTYVNRLSAFCLPFEISSYKITTNCPCTLHLKPKNGSKSQIIWESFAQLLGLCQSSPIYGQLLSQQMISWLRIDLLSCFCDRK